MLSASPLPTQTSKRHKSVIAKTITILGSTGSVGCSTIDLIERNRDLYKVVALTANRNVAALAAQARKLKVELAVVADETCKADLEDALRGTGIEVAAGQAGLIEAANREAQWVMAAIVGAAGLAPTLAAVRRGAEIALANKECLVCAGDYFMQEVARHKATLLPVDSEHNAIFQVLERQHPEQIEKIILTASGGPFREKTTEFMEKATPEQAVAHPKWDMGAKISVDSATLMNKGLELIEAYHLFPVDVEQLDVVVHPESIVHSMVDYKDGSVLAQLGSPDMRIPIAYMLAWPHRMATPVPRLSLTKIGSLTFEAPDYKRFPALALAREAMRMGGVMPTILNAANEIAVEAFLNRRIGFSDIARNVEAALTALRRDFPQNGAQSAADLAAIEEIDHLARKNAAEWVQKHAS